MTRESSWPGVAVLGTWLLGAASLGGCSDGRGAEFPEGCRKIDKGARTAGAAAETGGKTAVEGVKTLGGAIGGLVEGGTPEAEARWNEGKKKTSTTAKEGAADVDATASEPTCDE